MQSSRIPTFSRVNGHGDLEYLSKFRDTIERGLNNSFYFLTSLFLIASDTSNL